MFSEDLKKIKEKIGELKKLGKMSFLESATIEQIDDFEKKSKISLPVKYKEWLQYCDGGELFLPAGIQFYGVTHKPLIDVNDDDRPNDSYIVIGALATGDPILCQNGKEVISIYNHEAGKIEDDEIYDDFYAFLDDLVNILGIGD